MPQLPDGVSRAPQAPESVTLENCHAIEVFVEPPSGTGTLSIVVWKDRQLGNVRPVEKGKRLRDLRPGDEVVFCGEVRKVVGLSVYR